MATTRKTEPKMTGKSRINADIVEIAQGMRRAGLVSDAELEKVTISMLGRDALPKVAELSAAEIAKVREGVGVSQAVMAGFLNVTVSTISQWERGFRRPTGTALKLLHVVKTRGLAPLQV